MRNVMIIKAHVPTQQYGFVEVEGSLEERAEIERLYNHYAETPIVFKSGEIKRLKAFVGGFIDYDEVAHSYTWNGEVYLSGSAYANSFKKPFDSVAISQAMAKKSGVSAEDIVKMWGLKSEASRDFGNAIHKALQLYEQYKGLAEDLEKTYHLHDHPIIKNAVESFMDSHKERALSEVLVVDHKAKRAGQIDRLVILGDKHCRVEDYKTNADVTKELEFYWKQLEFYGDILKADGWKVEPPVIHHFDGEWHQYDFR